MSNVTALAAIPQPADTAMQAYTPRDLSAAVQLATHFAKSGLLGELNTPEKVMLVMATGAELGIPPTTALRSIHIIKGKPVCSADLIVSLCLRRKERCEYFSVIESTATSATYETKPVGRPPVRNTFTLDDAERAGLSMAPGSNWSKYTKAMLRHRASAELARMVYPDLVLGIYSDAEEDDLSGPVTIEQPIKIETPPPPAAAPVEAAKPDLAARLRDWLEIFETTESLSDAARAAREIAAVGDAIGPSERELLVSSYKLCKARLSKTAPSAQEVVGE